MLLIRHFVSLYMLAISEEWERIPRFGVSQDCSGGRDHMIRAGQSATSLAVRFP